MSIRHKFITHFTRDAKCTLKGCFKYACTGAIENECNGVILKFDFELRIDKNVVTLKAKFDSCVEKLELDENLGFFFNCNGNGLAAWRCIINRLWSKLGHNGRLYDEFMTSYFDCSISNLYEGCF